MKACMWLAAGLLLTGCPAKDGTLETGGDSGAQRVRATTNLPDCGSEYWGTGDGLITELTVPYSGGFLASSWTPNCAFAGAPGSTPCNDGTDWIVSFWLEQGYPEDWSQMRLQAPNDQELDDALIDGSHGMFVLSDDYHENDGRTFDGQGYICVPMELAPDHLVIGVP